MRLRVPVTQTPGWFRDAANAINSLLGDIPDGGTTNQALVKASADDWDLTWADFASAGHVHAASTVTFTPAGSIAAANVQAAVEELGTEKEPAITAGTTAQYWRGDKSFQTLDKAAVGLGSVDNTSDAAKPVSTAQQTALDLKLNSSAYTAADVLTKLLTVDGADSGLDADLLDGNSSAAFATAGHTHAASSITSPAALTRTDDTNVTLTLGGSPTTALLAAASLTLGWTGTLAVARGGTGAATAADARTNLGLGTAAVKNTGTSGNVVSLLDGANTWSGGQTMEQLTVTGASSFINVLARTAGDSFLIFSDSSVFNFYSGGVQASLTSAGVFDVTGAYRVDGTQVVGNQGAAVADATDAASAITQLNALLARCRAHGFIAT